MHTHRYGFSPTLLVVATALTLFRSDTRAAGSPLAGSIVFVEDGQPKAAKMIGEEWIAGEGYLESDAKPPYPNPQALYSNVSIGSGDFRIKAELTVFRRRGRAGVFTFGAHSFFGLQGGHGAMYVTGPFFNNARGDKVGNLSDYVKDGEPFTFGIARKEDVLHVVIGDKTVYTQRVKVEGLGPAGFCPGFALMRIHEFSATAHFDPYVEPRRRKAGATTPSRITRHPFVQPTPSLLAVCYVRLADGGILGMYDNRANVSYNEGKTWESYPVFEPLANMRFRKGVLVSTRDGAAIFTFVNEAESKYSWDDKANRPNPDCRRPTYAIRSLDNGRTWVDLQQIDDTYCGCLNDAIQTVGGNVVVTGQELLYKEARHTTRPYVSGDDGKSWVKADKLDMEMKPGNHQGLIEATLTQLKDGRLWILLRSYHGHFYESFSEDGGLTWSKPKPSIKSTGSPGIIKRLASGRLMLMWNAIPNKGYKRREELSIAFSEDDGKTWTDPLVILRNPGSRVAYPRVFERALGEIWFSVGQGNFRGSLEEADMLEAEARGMKFLR